VDRVWETFLGAAGNRSLLGRLRFLTPERYGYPQAARGIGITTLGGKCNLIYVAQSVVGKILLSKELDDARAA